MGCPSACLVTSRYASLPLSLDVVFQGDLKASEVPLSPQCKQEATNGLDKPVATVSNLPLAPPAVFGTTDNPLPFENIAKTFPEKYHQSPLIKIPPQIEIWLTIIYNSSYVVHICINYLSVFHYLRKLIPVSKKWAQKSKWKLQQSLLLNWLNIQSTIFEHLWITNDAKILSVLAWCKN